MPAKKNKKCNDCRISLDFTKKCRKLVKPQSQASQPQQTNFNQIETTTTKSDDGESVNYITGYQQLYDQVYYSNHGSDSDDYVAVKSSDTTNQLEPLNAKIQ